MARTDEVGGPGSVIIHCSGDYLFRVESGGKVMFKDLAMRTWKDGAPVIQAVGSTDELAWYAGQLAALEAPFRVLGPPELREAVAALAGRLREACRPDDAG